jgi:hypothetical protein
MVQPSFFAIKRPSNLRRQSTTVIKELQKTDTSTLLTLIITSFFKTTFNTQASCQTAKSQFNLSTNSSSLSSRKQQQLSDSRSSEIKQYFEKSNIPTTMKNRQGL